MTENNEQTTTYRILAEKYREGLGSDELSDDKEENMFTLCSSGIYI
ncbi:MAG: hypothetical protein AABZ32_02715 [Bacteroidota bacterium]